MQTVGIDLATQPKKTAVCVILWSETVSVHFGDDTSDAALIEACATADKVGIDCPFGWPMPFVDAISAHALGARWPGYASTNELAYRLTDIHVREEFGVMPLAVATDHLGRTAMRCATLLSAMGPVDRTGRDKLAEVYPAVALKSWGLPCTGLKRAAGAAQRAAVLTCLQSRMSEVLSDAVIDQCASNDDKFDELSSARSWRAPPPSGIPVIRRSVRRSGGRPSKGGSMSQRLTRAS